MTYDDMKVIGEQAQNTKEIEAKLDISGGEAKQSIIEKIKKAYNVGYAKGFKKAQDKYRVDDINLEDILKG